MKTMSEALRRAIRDSGQSLYAIARDTGLQLHSVSRFLRGQTSLRLDLADRLAQHFGLELRPAKPKRGKAKTRKRR